MMLTRERNHDRVAIFRLLNFRNDVQMIRLFNSTMRKIEVFVAFVGKFKTPLEIEISNRLL